MIKDLAERVKQVKQSISNQINELPQNENIQMVNGSVNAFTMKFSELSKDKVFSPHYYDFRHQYKMIVELLENTPIEKFEDKFNNIIESGKVVYQKNTYALNPKVIDYLKTIKL